MGQVLYLCCQKDDTTTHFEPTMRTSFKNLLDLLDYYEDEAICRQLLEEQRWNGKPVCPHCGHDKVYRTDRGFKCADKKCYKKFSVTVGTVFENTKIPLRIWFAAIYVCTSHKKGIASHQLAKDLGITQKTAWFLMHRIREMLKEKAPQMLKNVVEADETYIGGKEKNKHQSKKTEGVQGRSTKTKTAVFGITERGGDVVAYSVEHVDTATLQGGIEKYVEKGATVNTDEWGAYNGLSENYTHEVVNHGAKEYAREFSHTNNIESFWALLKRGIVGIYHHVSPKHLDRYCNEFSYRYNTKKAKDADRFFASLKRTHGRLTYKRLINKP